MSATSFKSQGNEYFKKEEWEKAIDCYSKAIELEKDQISSAPLFANRAAARTHHGKLDQALEDAILCTRKDPKFSKGFARIGEIQVRRGWSDDAKDAYERAIRLSESPQVKSRYQTALDKILAESPDPTSSRTIQFVEGGILVRRGDDWVSKVEKAVDDGSLEIIPGGGIALLQQTYELARLTMVGVKPASPLFKGRIGDTPISTSTDLVAEALLIDPAVFFTAATCSAARPFAKLTDPNTIDQNAKRLVLCLESRENTPDDLMYTLEERVEETGWQPAHDCVLQMSSFLVLRAWRFFNEQDYDEKPMHLIAIAKELVNQAVNRWGKSLDSTGNRARFVRLLRLLRARALQIESEGNLWSPKHSSVGRQVATDFIEQDAKELLEENARRNWSKDMSDPGRLAYEVLPLVESYIALARVYKDRAYAPIAALLPGKSGYEDSTQAKMSARYYELAAKLLPNDHHLKAGLCRLALAGHIRGGGKTREQLIQLHEETKELIDFRSRFFESFDSRMETSKFVESEIAQLRGFEDMEPDAEVAPLLFINVRGFTRNLEGLRRIVDRNLGFDGGSDHQLTWFCGYGGDPAEEAALVENVRRLGGSRCG